MRVTLVCVIPGPSFILATAADDRETRWCFQCRKHLPHAWELVCDPPERQPSYYDPNTVIRCSGCGESHIHHPGIYWDGPDYPSEAVGRQLSETARKTMDLPEWKVPYEAAMERWRRTLEHEHPSEGKK